MGCQSPFETARESVLVSFTSKHSKDDWAEYKSRNMVKLQPMAVLIYSAAGINFKLTPEPVELSKREEERLIWAARGETYHDIAGILNLSASSVLSDSSAALSSGRTASDLINSDIEILSNSTWNRSAATFIKNSVTEARNPAMSC